MSFCSRSERTIEHQRLWLYALLFGFEQDGCLPDKMEASADKELWREGKIFEQIKAGYPQYFFH